LSYEFPSFRRLGFEFVPATGQLWCDSAGEIAELLDHTPRKEVFYVRWAEYDDWLPGEDLLALEYVGVLDGPEAEPAFKPKSRPPPPNKPPPRETVIVKVGPKWMLYTRDGSKLLGEHSSKEDAVAQEQAIEIAKAKRAKAGSGK
jgi:hypothetical protein